MRETRVVGRVGVARGHGPGGGQVGETGDFLVLGTGNPDRTMGAGRHGHTGEQQDG
ncbi:hypothetical protein [Kribbella sp. NBC_00889]|uniref:hypothetical protein n=1 Tax=Kribbella sp. NBC_00889 TaxID=2975974 RepID=UPI00386E39F7|nr:hypothetical protein OG817_32690 [Kribbella sp. NBC_00889]